MVKTPARRARAFGWAALAVVTALVLSALLVFVAVAANAVAVVGNALWNGAPYPPADPDAVAHRLKARSDWVYEEFALSGAYVPEVHRIDTGPCYYRGVRSLAHIDEARLDVSSFRLRWSVADVPEATAREAQRRVRQRLVQRGWELTYEGDREGGTLRELGFQFEDPDSGDMVGVDWNTATTTLFISVYAPCGQLPEAFDEYHWPEAVWHPEEQAAGR
ncbi:hypothetical protein JJV70_19350 [Streptomyces sp. JJ66]|uniref:hypothetical protein n=1 Tax=Streptomyces sp. JJ66 TaxID=2803843 RepID=UPI001C59767A|nr:hypothetical protein [Streptomyces sp. JJ66]MBW1604217.1 hypothetical protein [Streptomyces sp. JJ66]